MTHTTPWIKPPDWWIEWFDRFSNELVGETRIDEHEATLRVICGVPDVVDLWEGGLVPDSSEANALCEKYGVQLDRARFEYFFWAYQRMSGS